MSRARTPSLARALLAGSTLAGPGFLAAALVEGRLRQGFSSRRHPISSLSWGPRGWRQRANFCVTGVLYLGGAVALWSDVADGQTSPPGTWMGPALIGSVGAGLVGAGIYLTDPVAGYPPESTSLQVRTTTGALHDLCSTPVFLALPAAAFGYARAFARAGQPGWAAGSAAAAATQLVTFVLAGAGFSQRPGLADYGGLFQRLSLASGFGWLTALSARALWAGSGRRA